MTRATLITRMLTSACVLFIANTAHADDKPSTLPTFTAPMTEDFLRQLDSDQLRIVRRATRGCPGISRAMRAERNPCVTTAADREVAASGNPDLQAFHNALPMTERYDETRSSIVWRAWLPKP